MIRRMTKAEHMNEMNARESVGMRGIIVVVSRFVDFLNERWYQLR